MKYILTALLIFVSFISFAENIDLILTPPTKYSDGVDIEAGGITKHTVYCDNGVQVDIIPPDVSVIVDFPASDNDYSCYYTTTAHAIESDPSNIVTFSVGWVKTNPPIGLPIAGNPTRSINLSWIAPTENTDGSELTDLAGFNLYYGLSPTDLSTIINVNGAANTQLEITGITPNTYYFAVAAVNELGVQSLKSDIVTKEIN